MTVAYNEASIRRLKGLEGVRLRPGMYIPTTEHPHHLFKEVITNSIDERLAGFGDTIIVQKKDSAISIRDFGRGIPFGIHPEEKVSTLTLVATELHAGGKFSDNTYKVSGGLFGVGLSVVNALSSFLHIQSFRDGQSGCQQFSRGAPISEVIYSTTTEPNGTFISYIPDETIFDSINSNVELLLQEIYFIVCLNNVKVVCDFDGKQLTLQDMSISTLIDKFSSHKSVEIPEFTSDHSVFFRFAFALSNGASSRKFLFVNGVPVLKGNFLKIFFNSFAYYLNQAGLKFDSKDLHDTINLVLSIKAPVNIISFKGQVKEEANIDYSSMRQIFDYLFAFVFNSKSFQKLLKTQYKKVFTILLKRRRQDDEINRAFKELKKADSNSDSNLIVLPGKLTDCQAQNTGELFLVEGESIGYNTPILYNDKNGYLKFNWVSEIYDQEIFVDSLNLGFYNIESKRVQGVIKHNAKNKKMFRVTSQGGYPLDISNNHCIWVYNTKNQAFIEKDPEHIILKEDCLVSNKTLQSPNINCMELDISSQLIDLLKVDKSLHSYISIDSSEFDWGTDKGRIKLIGESLNFTDQMTQVAKKIGVEYLSLVHFNKGACRISISSFRKLCKHVYMRSSKYTKFRIDLEPVDSNKKYLQCTSSIIYSQVSDKVKALIRKITITEEIAYLIGRYLGEGYLGFKKGGNTSYIGLCLGEDNHLASVEISKIVQDLNFCDSDPYLAEPSITNKTLIIHSIELRALLYHLGLTNQVQVYDKFIPDIFFNCNVKIRNELLRGLYLSGGYLNLNRNYYKLGFESTSLKLAQGMFLLHRLDNRLPVWQETSLKKAVICGNSCNTRGNFRVVINRLEDLYAIEDICKRFVSYNEEIFYREREIRKSSRIILNAKYPDLIFLPIKEVKPIDYANSFIYDLSIKDNENFPSGIHGAIIHNSSAGTCKQARDRKFQAILPLKGKVLNVLKSNYATTMKNEVIQDLMIAIGISIKGKNLVINPRYSKIILSVDADSVSENTDIVFINSENLIDCKKVKDISKDEIKYVFSLNPITNDCEIKEVFDVISHDYDKGFINKVTVYGNHSEEYTDDHMLFLYDKIDQKVKQVSPLDIEINRHLFLASEYQPFLNKKFNIDIMDHLFNVAPKNNNIRIRINSNDFDWKTLKGRINIGGGKVRYINTTRSAVARKLGIKTVTLQMYDTGRDNTKAPLSIINELQKLTVLDLRDSIIDLSFIPENKKYIKLGSVVMLGKENDKIRTSIPVTKELAYVIGAYLGNGCWGSSKNNPYETLIDCGEKLYLYNKLKSCCHECGFIQTVKDGIGTTNIKIKIKSVELHALLDYFGLIRSVHCDTKFIPKIFFSCEEKVRVWLLMGLYDTDGSLMLVNEKKQYRLSYSSTSLQLINDLLLMLKQFSVVGDFTSRDDIGKISGYNNKDKSIVYRKIKYQVNINYSEDLLKLKQVFEHRPEFNINIITQIKSNPKFISIGKGTILLPIRKVERVSYTSNKVYDLSVKDNQTFSCGVQGLNIHNSDGSHIRTLLLAFFLKWGRPLIEHGYIYVSRLPIFLVRNKRLGSRFVYEEHLLQKKKGDVISRFKGLGEMNSNELETTLFNPQTRKLEQVKITNLVEAATVFQVLMGSESEMRASFLQYFSTEFDHINLDL